MGTGVHLNVYVCNPLIKSVIMVTKLHYKVLFNDT